MIEIVSYIGTHEGAQAMIRKREADSYVKLISVSAIPHHGAWQFTITFRRTPDEAN